jgi:PAS domain S-box-containing protein
LLNLDIRTLSFIATLTSLLLAVGLQIVNRVITRNPALRLWAMGSTAIGGGFVLLALRGLIPDLLSIIVANTLLATGGAWHYLGNRAFQGRNSEFPWYWWLAAGTAALFLNFTYLMPNLGARIAVISVVLAALRFASAQVLLSPGKGQDRLVRWCVAGAYLITAVFLSTRAAVTLLWGPTDQNFMAASATIQTFAFVLEININLILGIGLPLLVLGRTQRQSLKSEMRLRTIIENEPECIKIVDAQGRLTQMNPAGLAMIEADSEEQVLGLPVSAVIAPEYHASFAEMHQRVLAGETVQMEFEVKGLKGGHRWLETHAVPMQEEGKTVHLAVTRDISARKLAEAELLRSNRELEQFSYSISHDMRQPLRMISSYLQLLQSGLGDTLDPEKRSYFNFAIDGAQRLDAMLRGLLEYSRIGRKGGSPTWIDSRTALDEALLFLRPAIAEAHAELRIEGDWPRVLASQDEMLRLLQNLVGNALKFRVEDRMPVVTVSSEIIDGHWRFCVADNGVGILPDQIDRLFQVFQRLHSRATYEGTGIGLALCRKIAEHHGGSIRAESAGEGLGSRFCVELPLAQTDITARQPEATPGASDES